MQQFKTGKQTVEKLKSFLTANKIPFVDIGREHTIKSPVIAEKLNQDSSFTACYFRFQPDLFVYRDNPCLVEVKTGKTITKECYQHYLFLEQIGLNLLLVFYSFDKWYYSKPSELPFFAYPSENGLMYHRQLKMNIPVQGHWVHPRRMKKENVLKYRKHFKCSGQAFANIDMKKLKPFIV